MQINLFAEETQLERLSQLGDSLERLKIIDFESFRSTLTDAQKENNRRKSRIRSRIEPVFGFMTMSMRGLTVRTIGLRRAAFNIGLTNLVYNLYRYSTTKGACQGIIVPFCGNQPQFWGLPPHLYMKLEFVTRFAASVSFISSLNRKKLTLRTDI